MKLRIKKILTWMAMLLVCFCSSLFVAGCGDNGEPVEEAGETVEEAAEETQEAAEEAAEETEEAMEDAADEMNH